MIDTGFDPDEETQARKEAVECITQRSLKDGSSKNN
jgi:hypothetical protein